MIIIKNSKGEMVDIRPLYNIDIKNEIELYGKIIEEYRKKLYETTKFPKDRLKKLY